MRQASASRFADTPLTDSTILAASKDQVSAGMEGETVILNAELGTYFCLNDVGSRVWDLVATPISLGDIHRILLPRSAAVLRP
ncbi:MAG: PqqD family protein [Cyanophyceae cyanobacterium]